MPPFRETPTEQRILRAIRILSGRSKEKNKHTLAGKSKLQNINIKVKENKTRITIKISEFYK